MRIALIARPQWENSRPAFATGSRLISAPLQLLQCVDPDPQPLEAMKRTTSPWVVFTSPASVQAMDQWIEGTGVNPIMLPAMRLAAVGSGTRGAMLEMAEHRKMDGTFAWPIEQKEITVSATDDRADAAQLLQALDQQQEKEGFAWKDQTFLLAQGEDNRSALADGLRERGAHVMALAMYRRKDVAWPESIWNMIAQSGNGECGVVVTSSTVIARLMADVAAHGLNASHLTWCTQHAAIAEKLRSAGVVHIRRVALAPLSLEKDLFEHERHW